MTDKILEIAKKVRVSKQTIQSETGKILYEEFSFNSEQLEAFANIIRAEYQWISVNDRLPKDYQYVIALEDDGEIYKLMFVTNKEGNFWSDIQDYYYHNVTHWMPLPKAMSEKG